MWLFKKKKKPADEGNSETTSDKVASKIAGAGIKAQKLFADKMNKVFEGMTNKRIKIVLTIFCLAAGGYSLYLLGNAVFSPSQKQPSFKIEQASIPKHINKAGDETILQEATVDEETFNKIRDFKKYMDSIKIYKKAEYDSILINRPGLMDSVQMLEQIYLSQNKNELYEK